MNDNPTISASIVRASVHLRRAQAKSCSQVVPITAALAELEGLWERLNPDSLLTFERAIDAVDPQVPEAAL